MPARRRTRATSSRNARATSSESAAEIMSRPWEECDAAWLAIKTRVLCVFWAIGAKMIRAWADGTLDFAAALRARPAT